MATMFVHHGVCVKRTTKEGLCYKLWPATDDGRKAVELSLTPYLFNFVLVASEGLSAEYQAAFNAYVDDRKAKGEWKETRPLMFGFLWRFFAGKKW